MHRRTEKLLKDAEERLKRFENHVKYLTLDSLANRDIKETFALISELSAKLREGGVS